MNRHEINTRNNLLVLFGSWLMVAMQETFIGTALFSLHMLHIFKKVWNWQSPLKNVSPVRFHLFLLKSGAKHSPSLLSHGRPEGRVQTFSEALSQIPRMFMKKLVHMKWISEMISPYHLDRDWWFQCKKLLRNSCRNCSFLFAHAAHLQKSVKLTGSAQKCLFCAFSFVFA